MRLVRQGGLLTILWDCTKGALFLLHSWLPAFSAQLNINWIENPLTTGCLRFIVIRFIANEPINRCWRPSYHAQGRTLSRKTSLVSRCLDCYHRTYSSSFVNTDSLYDGAENAEMLHRGRNKDVCVKKRVFSLRLLECSVVFTRKLQL